MVPLSVTLPALQSVHQLAGSPNPFIQGFYKGFNGTPLQYSCLENPMDGGAWQAAVHGVSKTERLHFHFSLSCIGEGPIGTEGFQTCSEEKSISAQYGRKLVGNLSLVPLPLTKPCAALGKPNVSKDRRYKKARHTSFFISEIFSLQYSFFNLSLFILIGG